MILEVLTNYSFFLHPTTALLHLGFLLGVSQLYYKILPQRKAVRGPAWKKGLKRAVSLV